MQIPVLKNLTITNNDPFLIITVNRENQLNALNRETLSEIEEAILYFRSSSYKGAIITGSGKKAFIAGADIKEFSSFSITELENMVVKGQHVMALIENCPKPIIAAVNGYALGGGCELAMSCHLRVASENALFGLPETGLGIIPGYGGTQRMPMLIGKTRALELMMTGETINAETALDFGLINQIAGSDDLIPSCLTLLHRIMANSPHAIGHLINAVNASCNPDINGFETEVNEFTHCVKHSDFKEGTSAFIEKKTARFKS